MEPFVGVAETAAYLAVKKNWVYEMVRLGRSPSCKIRPFRRFRLSQLEAWAREHQVPLNREKD